MMSEAERRLQRCCFTGHRPEKLHIDEATITQGLRLAIERSIADGFLTYISGMSRGVDIWAAEQVLLCRRRDQRIHLICALPHPDFETRWGPMWQKRYRDILQQADWIETVCGVYSRESYQIRNEWMVNHCSRIIAVYHGEKGGTKNTLEYTLAHNTEILYVHDAKLLSKGVV